MESGGLSALLLATFVVLARLIEPDAFGVAALAAAIVSVLNLVVEKLFDDAIVQREDLDGEHLDAALWTCAGLGILLAGGCWLAADAIASLFDKPDLGAVVSFMALTLVFNGASSVIMSNLRRNMLFKTLALRSLLARALGALVAVLMAVAGYGVWCLAAQYVVTSAVGAIFVCWRTPYRPAFRFSVRHLRQLLGFGVPAFLTQLSWNSNPRIFAIFLGYFLSAADLGYYEIASRVMQLVRSLFLDAANQVALVMFSRRQGDLPALQRALMSATELACMTSLPIFGGLIVCADEIVLLALGAKWEPSVPVIQIFAAAGMLSALRQFAPVTYIAIGQPKLNLISALIGLLVSNGGVLLLGPMHVVSAAAISVSGRLTTFPLHLLFLRRYLGLRLRDQFKGSGMPLIASLVMIAVIAAAERWLIGGWSAAANLAVAIPLGAAIYVATIVLLSPQSAARYWRFLGEAIRKPGGKAVAGEPLEG